MSRLIRVGANKQAYLTAIRDAVRDSFDVVDFVNNYGEPIAFPTPWAHWKMEEAQGESRLDSTGNGRHLLETVTTGQVAGKFGNAALFDGINYSGLDLNAAPNFTNNTPYMVSCWIKHHMLSIPTYESTFYFYPYAIGFMYTVGEDLINAAISAWTYSVSPPSLDTGYGPANIAPDEWHLVVMYWDGTGLFVEVDNQAHVHVDAVNNGIDYPGGDISMGWVYEENATFAVDEMDIWVGDDALQAIAQRSTLWNNGNGWSPY